MQDKKARHQAIRMIVSSQHVESQNDLIIELEKSGISVGQATLSRDLKQLRVSKVRMPNGRSVYAFPRESQYATMPSREELNSTKWGMEFSGNIMVVHTPPGYANVVACEIDATRSKMMLGTVAGDDTIIVVLSEGADRDAVEALMRKITRQIKQ